MTASGKYSQRDLERMTVAVQLAAGSDMLNEFNQGFMEGRRCDLSCEESMVRSLEDLDLMKAFEQSWAEIKRGVTGIVTE